MTHPHTSPGPAEQPASASRGTGPGPAEPGVPVTVWPGLPAPPAGRDPEACPGPVTAASAARASTAFSRPGDLVAVSGGPPAVIQAVAASGRRAVGLHPGGEIPAAGQPALVIAGCHGPGCCSPEPARGEDPALACAACQRALAPGGILAVLTASSPEGGQLADLAGHVVAVARAAGLVYAQHIVIVHASIDGGHLAPAPSAGAGGGTQIHSDLLIFTKP